MITVRVSNAVIDSRLDDRWTQIVADLELGQQVTTTRYGLPDAPLSLVSDVVGYELVLEPDPRGEGNGRITGALNLSGSTPTRLDTDRRLTAGGDTRQTAGSDDRYTGWGNVT